MAENATKPASRGSTILRTVPMGPSYMETIFFDDKSCVVHSRHMSQDKFSGIGEFKISGLFTNYALQTINGEKYMILGQIGIVGIPDETTDIRTAQENLKKAVQYVIDRENTIHRKDIKVYASNGTGEFGYPDLPIGLKRAAGESDCAEMRR